MERGDSCSGLLWSGATRAEPKDDSDGVGRGRSGLTMERGDAG